MKFAAAAIASLVAAAAAATGAAATANPLSDVHQTSLDLYALGKLDEGGSFAVSVSRVDDLVGDNGKLLATKMYDVILMFDVPVQMGLSNIVMQAGTIVGVTRDGVETMDRAAMEDAFDVGVVGLQVMATSEKFTDPVSKQSVERIMIGERIFELNGNKVIQHTASSADAASSTPAKATAAAVSSGSDDDDQEDTVMGQIIDIYANGTMVRQKACPMSVGNLVLGTRKTCLGRVRAAFAKWVRHVPASAVRAAVAAVALPLGLVVAYAAVVAALSFRSLRRREAQDAELAVVVAIMEEADKMDADEKGGKAVVVAAAAAPLDEEEALPVYVAGYAPVPREEEMDR
ncbi:hypothetical protein DFJ73DRAFT_848553 [Zopfochytrium polystomum]|nr:hypothetical protein DFJ73DRAFT_848553 [Zopfochytrium polystomum]